MRNTDGGDVDKLAPSAASDIKHFRQHNGTRPLPRRPTASAGQRQGA
jgi:hypothetical protein